MSTRREFGTVRKLPSGRWQARYPDTMGRLVPAPETFTTKSDAARFLVGVQADQNRGNWLDPRAGKVTFAAWSEDWLARPGKRRTALARDRQAVTKYVRHLGTRPLGALTPPIVRAAVEAEAAKVAPATAKRDVGTLRAILNAAVEADYVARSPLRGVKLAAVQPPERCTLSPDDLGRLADAIAPRFRALMLVGGVLGLRWSEAIALRVRDLDLLRSRLTVAATISEVAGHLAADETKTRAGRRSMALPQVMVEEFAAHLAAHRPGAGPDDLVFVGEKGGTLRRSFVARHLHPAAEVAGLPSSLTFHGLRHVATSLMVETNEHPKVMQTRLGHATPALTLGLYAHVSEEADRAAAARTNDLLTGVSADLARGRAKGGRLSR